MSASSLPPSTSALPSTPVSIETTTRTAGTAPGAVSGPASDAAAASRKHALPAADRGWLPDAVGSDKAARGTTRATAARKAREDAEEALPRDTSMADADRSVIEALQGVSAEGGAGGVQVAQAGSGGVVSDAPIVLAQASGAAGAGAATVPAAAVPPATGTVFGSMGWLAVLGAVGVAAAASSSDSSAPAATTPTAQGTVIDGYLSGATVFIDVNGNGQLDAGEPNTTTDAQGNYTLPGASRARSSPSAAPTSPPAWSSRAR